MSDNVVAADGDKRIDPLRSQRELLKKITSDGSRSQIAYTLEKHGPLDLVSLANETELSVKTLRGRLVGKMKKEGIIEETKDENGDRIFNARPTGEDTE